MSLAGCATPGPPLPPTLDLPRPVTDLEATRQGNAVLLTWTLPSETTDKLRVRHPGATAVCRKITPNVAAALSERGGTEPNCEPVIETILPSALVQASAASASGVPSSAAQPAKRVSYTLQIPQEMTQQYPDSAAVFSIEALNANGRGAGFSNAAAVPLAPAFPPPPNIETEQTKTAIVITWERKAAASVDRAHLVGYRVERNVAGSSTPDERLFVTAGSPSDGRLEDTQFTWNKQYVYRIASVTGVLDPEGRRLAEVQGDWSEPIEIATRDVFPPSAPSGVQAVFTQAGQQRFIDLTWLPNTEADLAGYYLYRRTEGGQPQRMNSDLLKAPAYRDTDIAPGARYFYSVSAVDLRGNESARSPESSETVPPQ